MINLTVNGKPRQAPVPLTLTEFLKTLSIKTQFVAVGYNGEVLDKEDFSRVTLKDGDVLEIVRPVGGG
ncbi:MAG: sulfur carrier protein ThiS [SAR202 cluster bacterium]|nr:sulfur carrier protein ThiS [SAR202 cluster bacterium]